MRTHSIPLTAPEAHWVLEQLDKTMRNRKPKALELQLRDKMRAVPGADLETDVLEARAVRRGRAVRRER
jgi:hypothetical protein